MARSTSVPLVNGQPGSASVHKVSLVEPSTDSNTCRAIPGGSVMRLHDETCGG